ncbi:MAG: hypothetical protein LBR89_04925 [Holosporales bacterium]|nr:hypothetical protein [Holosporales bacterium]
MANADAHSPEANAVHDRVAHVHSPDAEDRRDAVHDRVAHAHSPEGRRDVVDAERGHLNNQNRYLVVTDTRARLITHGSNHSFSPTESIACLLLRC